MQFRREDYIALMTFQPTTRPWLVELFGPLVGLEDQWREQGASEAEIDLTAFDFDYVPRAACGGFVGLLDCADPTVLEKTEEYIIQRDGLGRTVKLYYKTATIPLPLDFPVKTMDDWLRLKPRFQWREDRVDPQAIEAAIHARANGAMVLAGLPGGFALPRELMGDEAVCLACYEQPELLHDILDTLAETAREVFQRVTDNITIDQLCIHEDMAGKSGPLLGPTQMQEFLVPYYRNTWDLVSSRGTKLCSIDSDGNLMAILDDLTAGGVNILLPNEPAAGMDIVAIRERMGDRLALSGGIDKFALRGTKEDIRRELESKLTPELRSGGTIFGLDHRIPDGTPLENYRYYVDLAREMLGIEPRLPEKTGWQRMAM